MSRVPVSRIWAGALLCLNWAPAAETESRFTTLDGTRIHYESYGEGDEALVFVHGWTCDLTFWRGQEPVYTTHRSLLIDLPGHGKSAKPRRSYPTEFFARAVEAAMTDAGVNRAVIVGHSLGSGIAYTFIRLFPDRVKGIVIVDAVATRPAGPPTAKTLARYRERAHALSGPAGEKNFERQVNAMFSDRTSPKLRNEIRSKMLATPEHVRVAAVTSVSKLRAPNPGESFETPVLAITSTFSPERVMTMRSFFPHLEIEKWDEYGHFLMLEDPERFNRTLETFLLEHP